MRGYVVSAAGLGLAVSLSFAACSLDLDDSLINTDASAGTGGSNTGGFGGSGGGFGGGSGGKEAGPACDANAQCDIDGGCLEGICVSGNCSYEICPAPSACQARACNGNTCAEPAAVSFAATVIPIPDVGIGCGGDATKCLAAFEDYAFVGTADGVLHGWRITDPANPVELTVEGPIFTIARMVASEGRLLLLSTPVSSKLQLAWIDLPADPLTTALPSSAAGVNYTGSIFLALPGTFGSFHLVDSNPFPSVLIEPPIPNNSSLALVPLSLPNGRIVASMKTSLLGFYLDSSVVPYVPNFITITEAGTATVATSATVALSYEAPAGTSAHQFTSTRDGSVLWSTNRIERDGAQIPSTPAVMFRWLFPNGGTQLDGAPELELATYSSSGDPDIVRAGPSALVDSSTAITTIVDPNDSSATVVRAIKKTGSTLAMQTGTATLPFTTSSIGVSATRKFGLVLTPAATSPSEVPVQLHVFAPTCD